MELTKEQIESLAGFALDMLDEWPELNSIDGFEIQDIAEKHKLLIPRTVTEPCGETCVCAECYTDEEMQRGTTCYHMADWLKRDAQHRDEAVTSKQPCPNCDGEGTGFSEGESWTCSTCDGTGQV